MSKKCKFAAAMVIGCLSITLLAPVTHANEVISGKNPDAILGTARGYGSATLEKESGKSPFITGRMNGQRYGIFFSGCSNGQECDYIVFTAVWGEQNVSIKDVNTWNREFYFGKAYIDKKDRLILEMSVNLDYGVTQKNLDDTFGLWGVVLRRFDKEVLKQ